MALLPRTKSVALRATVLFLVILLACASVNSTYMLLRGNYMAAIIGLCIWLPLAYGLWNLNNSARIGISFLLWCVAILIPVGMINPFAAINGPGPPFPDVWDLVIQIYPCVAVAVLALDILGKHKREFT